MSQCGITVHLPAIRSNQDIGGANAVNEPRLSGRMNAQYKLYSLDQTGVEVRGMRVEEGAGR